MLRDISGEDVDAFLRWQTNGEWRFLDAPWEGILYSLSPSQEEDFRKRFLGARKEPPQTPRRRVVIALPDSTPIGTVNRYGSDRFPEIFNIGIDICEDNYLNRGLGTLALGEWRDYLFSNSMAHKLELHTWSFNPRMIRVAEKLGFRHEGTERELIEWQGEWLDRLRFGLLRSEWTTSKGHH
jgi:RimJ/RimL family protein N-acetyltransferase